MHRFFQQLRTVATRIHPHWLGFGASACVAAALYAATTRTIENDARLRFVNHARSAQSVIGAQIKSYTDVLRSAASFLQASDRITREQFRAYVVGLKLERHFPAMESINYAEYVPGDRIDDFVRRVRAEQQAHPFDTHPFAIKPPGKRAQYAVLTYIELSNVSANAFGFDLLSVPHAARATLLSRDTGEMVASGQIVAAISGPAKVGLAMRLPVYRPDMPLGTVAQRRAAYAGSAGIAFSMPKLVGGALLEIPLRDVRMIVTDHGAGEANKENSSGEVRVLFDSWASTRKPVVDMRPLPDSFVVALPIDYNGRRWTATFSAPKASLYTAFDIYLPYLAVATGFTGSLLFYALFHTLTLSRKRAIKLAVGMTRELRESQDKLQLSHQKLRRLAAHAEQIKERERKRIAREIHDDLGQNLLALRIEADMLASRTGVHHPRLHSRARMTLLQIDATIKSVRQIINDLRPNVLDLGLCAAVEWQIAEFIRRTGIDCQLVITPHDFDLHDNCAIAYFRILQESLTNVVRHADASRVQVELRAYSAKLTMTITDNGVGMANGGRNKPGSFGLVGIEERVLILGGDFSVISAPKQGTTIRVEVPVPPIHHPVDSAAQAAPSDVHTAVH